MGEKGSKTLINYNFSGSLLDYFYGTVVPGKGREEFQHEFTSVRNLGGVLTRREKNNRNEFIHLITYSPIQFKSKAFTLAEVLIIIGVIGVVSAMTIPNLITNYKAKQLHSQFLKSYSLIQQAFKQMEADDVSLNPQDYKAGKLGYFYLTFMKYFNGSMTCGTTAHEKNIPCYDSSIGSGDIGYKLFNGTFREGTPQSFLDDGQFVLPDGTNIMFENQLSTNRLYVSVDLNGYGNPPNRWGYDLFTFEFLDGELRAMGDNGTSYTNLNTYCYKNSTNSVNGIACAHLAKTNSDYFKDIVKNFK